MIDWVRKVKVISPKIERAIHAKRIVWLSAFLLGFSFFHITVFGGSAEVKISLKKKMQLPVRELSALSPYVNNQFIGIGDHKAEVLIFKYDGSEISSVRRIDFSKVLLDLFSLCSTYMNQTCIEHGSAIISNWEGIASDSSGRIFALQEHSGAVVSFLPNDVRNSLNIIQLEFDKFHQDQSNRHARRGRSEKLAEGMLLLKNGHILIVKESNPESILEFAPSTHDTPLGLDNNSVLGKREKFNMSVFRGVKGIKARYKQLKEWRFRGENKCDLSDLSYSKRKSALYLVSQKCKKIMRVDSLGVTDEFIEISQEWALPKGIKNPESMIILDDDRFLVGSDRRNYSKNNLYEVSKK